MNDRSPLTLECVGTPDTSAIAAHRAALTTLENLEGVCRWAYAQAPAIDLDTLAQDEFTFDVILPISPKAVVVFDVT